jgi:hypothetical protein
MSPDLKSAIQRSQDFLRQGYTDKPLVGMTEFFSHEPTRVQTEWAEFSTKLQRAMWPLEVPSMPEISQDLQNVAERMLERLREEQLRNGDKFDITLYSERIRDSLKDEPPHIQAEASALASRLQESNNRFLRVTQRGNQILKQVRALLQGEPVIAYRAGIEWEGMPSITYDTIVVAPTTDQFDILRYEQTNGANYELQTEDIIEKLKMADEKYGIDITGADSAGVEFILTRIPKGKEARELGRWLLDFCPDLYEAPRSFPKGKVALGWD